MPKSTKELNFTEAEAEIVAARQRLIKRNWRFFLVPIIILGIFLAVLVWEIIRQNMCVTKWPWNITILGIAPAATLVSVFTSLILAREQFARSMRPSLSWKTELINSEHLKDEAWSVRLMNFGPGLAHITEIKYHLTIERPTLVEQSNLSRMQAIKLLSEELGLEEGRDFFLFFLTPGAPIPVVKQSSEAFEFAAFRKEALKNIKKMNFTISVVDIMGDCHEKSLPFMATLPNSITNKPDNVLLDEQTVTTIPTSKGEANVKKTHRESKRKSRQ